MFVNAKLSGTTVATTLRVTCVAIPPPPAFASLPWEDARERLLAAEPTKYVDVNIRNLVYEVAAKHTIEVRILPVHLHAEPIVAAAARFEAMLLEAVG